MLRKLEWFMDDVMDWIERRVAVPLSCVMFILLIFYFCKALFEAGMRNQ